MVIILIDINALICIGHTQEAKTSNVFIEDFSPEIVEAFKKIMFGNDMDVDENELTVDLLMFANKYCILSLVKVVTTHLSANLTYENIFAVIEGAYLIENDELLQAAALFVKKSTEKFRNNDRWIKFKSQHPKCAVKLLDFMMQ